MVKKLAIRFGLATLATVTLVGPAASDVGSRGSAASQPAAATAASRTLFDNWNKALVANGPKRPTQFTLSTPATVTSILNYHWNNGKGQKVGTIALKAADGRVYGPWQAAPLPSAVPTANWIVRPNAPIPAGTYTVIDSHPATWSHNDKSGGAGFSSISGR